MAKLLDNTMPPNLIYYSICSIVAKHTRKPRKSTVENLQYFGGEEIM
ncbi:hypothetical protein BFRIPD_00007 (plasmid) [Peribacillus frigoritolerans]